jgi:quercetin dioxygenase-like cupin family protein
MQNANIEKARINIIVELIEYAANAVMIKTILQKSTGNISVMSFDSGEGLTRSTSPFDCFVQVIEGTAEFVIDNEPKVLVAGEGIIIPAHSTHSIKPNGRFKLLMTTIKSGYE